MEETFTIEEIKNYLLSQDSRGDIMYNLSAENIHKANAPKENDEDEPSNKNKKQWNRYLPKKIV